MIIKKKTRDLLAHVHFRRGTDKKENSFEPAPTKEPSKEWTTDYKSHVLPTIITSIGTHHQMIIGTNDNYKQK